MRNFDPKRKLLVLAKKFWAQSKVFVVQSCHKHSFFPKGRSSDLRRGCVTPGAVGLDDMRRSCGLSLWDVDSLLMFYELEAILRMTWGLGWGLLKGAGYFHSAGQNKEGNLVLALPSIRKKFLLIFRGYLEVPRPSYPPYFDQLSEISQPLCVPW